MRIIVQCHASIFSHPASSPAARCLSILPLHRTKKCIKSYQTYQIIQTFPGLFLSIISLRNLCALRECNNICSNMGEQHITPSPFPTHNRGSCCSSRSPLKLSYTGTHNWSRDLLPMCLSAHLSLSIDKRFRNRT